MATLTPASWTALATVSEQYFVGVLMACPQARLTVLNVYIPPHTSRYGPGSNAEFLACLELAQRWVTELHLQFGTIGPILWIGDFNARVGQLLCPTAADQHVNFRGRLLAAELPSWGYSLSPPLAHPNGREPFTFRQGGAFAESTLDYAWWANLPGPTPHVASHTAHWMDDPCPSPHAVLCVTATLPPGPALPPCSQPRPPSIP